MDDYMFNREGNPIDCVQFGLLVCNRRYVKLARTLFYAAELEREYEVSTVWLGIDHSFGDSDKPVMFETLIFADGDDEFNLWGTRYTSEDAALAGHRHIAAGLAATLSGPLLAMHQGHVTGDPIEEIRERR